MSQLPPQLDFYYQVTRSRCGLTRMHELVGSIDINAAIGKLPPPIFAALTFFDVEIFGLLVENGADIEMTWAKADKLPMPDLKDMAGGIAMDMASQAGKAAVGGVWNQILSALPILRQFGFRSADTRQDSLTSQIGEQKRQHESVEAFVQKEAAFWRELGGTYFEDMTPFAAAVFRKGGLSIDRLLDHFDVDPNPTLKGRTLAEIIREDGREQMAARLEAAAVAKTVATDTE